MLILISFSLIFLLIIVLCFFYALYYGLIYTVPWVPVTNKDVERILKIAEIKPNDILYDLGSGDGKIIIAAAKKHNIQTRGIELAWPLCLWSNLMIRFAGCGKLAHIKCGNFLKEDFSEATIVVFYLTPKIVQMVMPKIRQELKPGTKIISAAFQVRDLIPIKIDRPAYGKPIYYYQL